MDVEQQTKGRIPYAAKFTARGGEIEVACDIGAVVINQGTITVHVRDPAAPPHRE